MKARILAAVLAITLASGFVFVWPQEPGTCLPTPSGFALCLDKETP